MTVRELNGWSPASVTLDRDGNVLSVTVQEPRFTRAEVGMLVASRRAEFEPRGDHGLPLRVSMDPANQFAKWDIRSQPDFAAVALAKAKKAYSKAYPDVDMSTVMWSVELPD